MKPAIVFVALLTAASFAAPAQAQEFGTSDRVCVPDRAKNTRILLCPPKAPGMRWTYITLAGREERPVPERPVYSMPEYNKLPYTTREMKMRALLDAGYPID